LKHWRPPEAASVARLAVVQLGDLGGRSDFDEHEPAMNKLKDIDGSFIGHHFD
jgi:hypothetical protein